MTQEELWNWMMEDKMVRRATAVLTEDVQARIWQGHFKKPEFIEETWKAGTKVKVVMASRFGDVGITKNLDAHHGYHARIQCVEVWETQEAMDSGLPPCASPKLVLSEITPVP